MKNQMDLIVSGVAVFLAITLSLVFMFTRKPALSVQKPAPIVTSKVAPVSGGVVMVNTLPGGSTTSSGGTSRGFGAPGGAPGGFGGGGGSRPSGFPGGNRPPGVPGG